MSGLQNIPVAGRVLIHEIGHIVAALNIPGVDEVEISLKNSLYLVSPKRDHLKTIELDSEIAMLAAGALFERFFIDGHRDTASVIDRLAADWIGYLSTPCSEYDIQMLRMFAGLMGETQFLKSLFHSVVLLEEAISDFNGMALCADQFKNVTESESVVVSADTVLH